MRQPTFKVVAVIIIVAATTIRAIGDTVKSVNDVGIKRNGNEDDDTANSKQNKIYYVDDHVCDHLKRNRIKQFMS